MSSENTDSSAVLNSSLGKGPHSIGMDKFVKLMLIINVDNYN